MPADHTNHIMTQSDNIGHTDNTDNSTADVLSLALDAIDELKAESIKTLDVSALTTIADHMVICNGRSARHVKSISDNVIEHAKKAGLRPHTEGRDQAEWILIDLNGVIVHILQPTARAYYQLEKLWDIDIGASETRHNS